MAMRRDDDEMGIRRAIHDQNVRAEASHQRRFTAIAEQLARQNKDVDSLIEAIGDLEIALPSWAFWTGGTRFGRFPGGGEPRSIYEKLEDAAVIHQLTRATPRVSLRIPGDEPDDVSALVAEARRRREGGLDPIAAFRSSGYRGARNGERSPDTYAPPQSL